MAEDPRRLRQFCLHFPDHEPDDGSSVSHSHPKTEKKDERDPESKVSVVSPILLPQPEREISGEVETIRFRIRVGRETREATVRLEGRLGHLSSSGSPDPHRRRHRPERFEVEPTGRKDYLLDNSLVTRGLALLVVGLPFVFTCPTSALFGSREFLPRRYPQNGGRRTERSVDVGCRE